MSNKNDFKNFAKKIVYTGIGAVAVAAEAAGGVVEKLAEKGEQIATESKIINDGKKAVKDFKENVNKSQAKKAMEAVVDMTKEEREALRKKLDEVEAEIREAFSDTVQDVAEDAPEFTNEEEAYSFYDDSTEATPEDEIDVELFYDVNPEENTDTEYAADNNEHTADNSEYTATNNDYTADNNEYTATNDNYTAANNDYTVTNNDYTTANNDYTATNNDYTAANNWYTALNNEQNVSNNEYTTSSNGYTTNNNEQNY